jgi:hypothetical protein
VNILNSGTSFEINFHAQSVTKTGTTTQATNKMRQFRFIDPFKSALHISGANYAQLHEHFDRIYSFWYDTPTLLPTGDAVVLAMQRQTNIKFTKTALPKKDTRCMTTLVRNACCLVR